MDHIDLNGTLRKEYRNDGTIAVHFDFFKEAHGTLTVSRDDEPILNDIIQMLKSREDRINLTEEAMRDLDGALRNGHDLHASYTEVYENAIGREFKRMEAVDGDETIIELRNEIARLRQHIRDLESAPKTTRRRRAA